MSLRYRPEIDGLRTVAVLSVLVYHLKTHFGTGYLFAGGFLGVDVFFVLSGYLITAILLREIAETNRISVARFYERRARRILPALFLVMAASTLVALAILMPSDLETFMKSLLASIFFISNMFWHSELGAYGAADGMYHPFLHTWSLAVEEQFYIFFPLLCLLLFRLNKRLILPTLIAMFLGGLVFAQVVTDIRPQLSFFWLPSRVWELVAGAILAQLALHHGGLCRGRWPDRVLPWVGMALILGPILTLSLGSITHPGLSTLPVVLGTCLVIWFATPENPVIRLLSSKPFTWVGLISYALYLWHYPIYAFGRHLVAEPGWDDYLIWMALSVTLAALSTHWIERPFRDPNRMPLRLFCGATVGALAVLVIGSTLIFVNDGYRGRFSGLIAAYGQNEFDNDRLRDASWRVLEDISPEGEASPWAPSRHEQSRLWFTADPETVNVLVVGNSHGKDLFNALWLSSDTLPKVDVARFGMDSHILAGQQAQLTKAPNFEAADMIIVAFRYEPFTLERLPAFLEMLAGTGKDVVLALNTAEFQDILNRPVFDWYTRQAGAGFEAAELARLAWEQRTPRVGQFNAQLREIAQQAGVTILDRAALTCDSAAETCDLITPDGEKMLFDYGHLTLEGARYQGHLIREQLWGATLN